MIKIVYDSLLGSGRRFAAKIGVDYEPINDYKIDDKDILLFTRSYDFGRIPETTLEFLEEFSDKLIGVAVNGNKNWGRNYGAAGKEISEKYNIPLILIYEGTGFSSDVAIVKEFIDKNYIKK